jgi:hypothetical protein
MGSADFYSDGLPQAQQAMFGTGQEIMFETGSFTGYRSVVSELGWGR